MPDEPELKETDPVAAIRESLNKALNSLKKLLGQEDEEIKEEMQEVEEGVQAGQGQVGATSDDTHSDTSEKTS